MVSPAWTEYFTLVGEVAVGIAGILFVSIQLTRERWVNDEIVWHLVLEAFSELLVPIFIALSVLLPATWPVEWAPFHSWLVRQMALLDLPVVSAAWQVVGIAAGIFGWCVAASTAVLFVKTWVGATRHTVSGSAFRKQVWIEWIPLGITFPSLVYGSLQGNLSIVGALSLWFVFSSMSETWLLFAESPAKGIDIRARVRASIQIDEVSEESARSIVRALPQSEHAQDAGLGDRLLHSFTSVYLTLSSIIQAGAFGYLAFTVATEGAVLRPLQWILAFTTLLLVVAAWNEYMMGATALLWIPQLLDSLIPFVLGIAEVSAVVLLPSSPAYWFLAVAAFALLSLFAYLNMYHSAAKAGYSNDLLAHLGWQKGLSVGYCAVASVLFAALFALTQWGQFSGLTLLAFGVVSALVAAGFLVRGHYYWKTITMYAHVISSEK